MRRKTMTAAAALAACGLVLAAPVQAGPAKSKSVKMFDNYYQPAKVTLGAGGTITWKWPVDVGDSHDVKLKSGPKGAKFTYTNDDGKKVTRKTFQSPPFASGPAKWSVKGFTKPGKYKLYCTFHETEMTMTVVVPKKK